MNDSTGLISTVRLTPREVEVLTLTAQGKRRAEISEFLLISEATVKEYVQSACVKLGAANKAQASIIALLLGLIAPYKYQALILNPIILRKKAKKPLRTEGARNFEEQISPPLTSAGKLNAPPEAA